MTRWSRDHLVTYLPDNNMPKNTFFNLPQDKRNMIFQAAVDEFAARNFAQASINRIVENAGIAKGSFYQYFENKKDLFLYILEKIGEEKLAYLAPEMENAAQADFFNLLRGLYLGGIRFAAEYPQYAEIGRKLLASKGTPIFNEVMQQNAGASQAFFEELLQAAIRRGNIRPDIDTRLFAYMIPELSTIILEYYTENVSQKYNEDMMATVDQFIDLLRFGIGAS